jgi:hypothetical protein
MKEEWRSIKETNGMYDISNFGRVRSRANLTRDERGVYNGVDNLGDPTIIKCSIHGMYYAIDSNRGGKRKILLVHRMVGKYFVFNPENKPFINHKDGDKLNNHYSNLEWCTHKENMQHAFNTGLAHRGEKCTYAKLKRKDVIKIRELNKNGVGYNELFDMFGTTVDNIRHICKYRSWKHI